MIYEAVLFDMDGVVIDTRQSVIDFWLDVAQTYSIKLTQSDFDQHIHGCTAKYTLNIVFPFLTANDRRLVIEKLLEYEANLSYEPVAGTPDLLRALHAHNVPTALVTSGDRGKVATVFNQLDLNGLFTTKVTVEDVRHGKPDPECYLQAAQILQKPPQKCIVFEDAVSGVKAATGAGALCIGVQQEKMARQLINEGAWHVVPNLCKVQLRVATNGNSSPLVLNINGDRELALKRKSAI